MWAQPYREASPRPIEVVSPALPAKPKLDARADEGALGMWLSEAPPRALDDESLEQRGRQAWLAALVATAALLAMIVAISSVRH